MEQVRGQGDAVRRAHPAAPVWVAGPGIPPHQAAPAGLAGSTVPAPRYEGQGFDGRHFSYPPMPAPIPWPAPAPAPAPSSGAVRALAVVAMTVLALAALVLAGVLLYPLLTATPGTTVVPAATPVAAPSVVSPAPSSGTGIYSCGTANGYSIAVQNGNVPCTSARWVTTMWTTDGTTPANGTGSAGTPYSWTCSSVTGGDTVGRCVSKMGSTFTISR